MMGLYRWRTRKTLLIVLTFLIAPLVLNYSNVIYFIVLENGHGPAHSWVNINEKNSSLKTNSLKHGSKTILLYPSYKYWNIMYGQFNQQCPQKCRFSMDRNFNKTSDALMFDQRYLQEHGLGNLPSAFRRSDQIWILHSSEAISKMYLDLKTVPNLFNWTSVPRFDADMPTRYGEFQTSLNKNIGEMKYNEAVRKFPSRQSLVAWAVSNCHAINHREEYVKELQKYVPIDIYGRCGKGERSKVNLDNCKFSLAFENTDCLGYVTEKLWNPLKEGRIPIVMGNSINYKRLAPPGSYIDVADFNSAKDLATYILKVATNKTLYSSYFTWLKHYSIGNNYWCDLCTAVHNWPSGRTQTYTDLYGWYTRGEQGYCTPWTIWKQLKDAFEEVGRIFYNPTPFLSNKLYWRFSIRL